MWNLPEYVFGTKISGQMVEIIIRFLLTGVFLFWALITQTGGHYVFRSIGIIISIALFAVIFYTGKWLLKIFLSFIFMRFYSVLII